VRTHFRSWCWPVVLLAASLALAPAFSDVAAADKGKATVEKTEYKGWKNNLRLSNGDVELIVTLDVGPRIISYRLARGQNVFKEYADQLGKSGEKDWQIRGGHRLWVGPEDTTRTYAADNGPVKYQEAEGKVRFTPAPETEYGIQKEIDLHLAPSGSRVRVVHRIKNVGAKATSLAPWALSVMAPDGVEIIPLPPKKDHPESAAAASSPKDFAPNQTMVLWPFFDFADPRWHFGSKYITLRQDPKRKPTKIGLAHQMGWVGYLNGGTLFVKRLDYQEDKTYPDNGCNFETYSNEDMLEVESLGPIVQLAPGKEVEMVETWDLVPNVSDFKDEAEIDRNVLPKLPKK
jgi:hypothetical protein